MTDNCDIESLELLVADLNGILRGKWAPARVLEKLVEPGVNLPISVFGLDVWGREVGGTGLHIESGDLDGFCTLVDDRIAPVSWTKQHVAQALLSMNDAEGKPFLGDPRKVLAKLIKRMNRIGLFPTVAIELEFYLVDKSEFLASGKISKDNDLANGPLGPDAQEMYSLASLREQHDFISEVRKAATLQGLPVDTIVKEAAPGQYEVNLHHRSDALKAADDAILLRRVIEECASKFGIKASFMAKPFAIWPGSGMHVHVSLLNKVGGNIFAGKMGKKSLRNAAAGLLQSMNENLILFVPTFNGYRRLQSGSYAPTAIGWGENNRSVAVRIPASDEDAKRLEHRIAGADANPYLVMLGVLGGMAYGIENGLKPAKQIKGNAYDKKLPKLTDNMPEALSNFKNSKLATSILGKKLHKLIVEVKAAELEAFSNEITPLERSTYL